MIDANVLNSDITNLFADVRNNLRGLYFSDIYQNRIEAKGIKEEIKFNRGELNNKIRDIQKTFANAIKSLDQRIEDATLRISENLEIIRSKEEFNKKYKLEVSNIDEQLTPYFEADKVYEAQNKDRLSTAYTKNLLNDSHLYLEESKNLIMFHLSFS
jgi:hypothetical protein